MMEVEEPNKNVFIVRREREYINMCVFMFAYNTVVHFSRPGCVFCVLCTFVHSFVHRYIRFDVGMSVCVLVFYIYLYTKVYIVYAGLSTL